MQPSTASHPETCDVLVIGGGPAGSTVAALLGGQGRSVVLVEKAQHPRCHIGVSLLRANVGLFERLGVRDQVEKIGMPKFGIEFISPDRDYRTYLEFAEAWNKEMPYAWQVRRSDLDALLFRHAATLVLVHPAGRWHDQHRAVCWPCYLKSRDKPLKEFFFDTIALCPSLAARLQQATLVDDAVHATGNYSYIARHCSGERYLVLGDAYTFIDPMFSTGVYLAMNSAFTGAEVVTTCLDQPAEAAKARATFERTMRKGPSVYSWSIFRVTNPTIRDMFMHPKNMFRVKEALMSMLAGDIFGKTPIWGALRMFKAIYYAISLGNFRRSFAGWKRHRVAIHDMGPLRGETITETK